MKQILGFLKKKDLYLGLARYYLGLATLPYALSKILRTQFVLFPEIWQQPLKSLSGKQLTWAFLGYSAWFQVLLGIFELVPALLLLFKRTTLLGGILMLPISLNVCLINYALNLWDGTKAIASLLLVLNVAVLNGKE